MAIHFTQFLRPDGKLRNVQVSRPPEIETMAKRLYEIGCRFEIENLRDGMINAEILLDGELLSGLLAENGPPLMLEIDRMITEAYAKVRTC